MITPELVPPNEIQAGTSDGIPSAAPAADIFASSSSDPPSLCQQPASVSHTHTSVPDDFESDTEDGCRSDGELQLHRVFQMRRQMRTQGQQMQQMSQQMQQMSQMWTEMVHQHEQHMDTLEQILMVIV